MVKLTQSLAMWLLKYHKDKYATISFGHLEDFTDDMKEEYLKWLKTEEGKSYLKGGSNYDKEYAKRIGVDND